MKLKYPYQEIKCFWCSVPMKILLGKDSMLWSWKVSILIIISYKNCIFSLNDFYFYFIDDHCQYWLNKADGTLTSPNFGVNDLGTIQLYDHNLNCTWVPNADQGFYLTLEIDYFQVNYYSSRPQTFEANLNPCIFLL